MRSTTIDIVIDKFNILKEDEKEFAMDILRRMFAESRRNNISRKAHKAEANVKAAKVKNGNSKELYNDLEND